MTYRNLMARLAGAAMLLGAGGGAVLRRQIWPVHTAGPTSGLEAALVMLVFSLTCLGLLFLLAGDGHHDVRGRRRGHGSPRSRRGGGGSGNAPRSEEQRMMLAAADAVAATGGHATSAMFLAMGARQVVAGSPRLHR